MEDYSTYSKEELIETLEDFNQPISTKEDLGIRLCEILSCENCPVTINNFDKRTFQDKCNGHEPCATQLIKWLESQ